MPDEKPRRSWFSASPRSLNFFASVPLVLVSVVAMTLNLASPADAATLKKPLKSKSNLPGAVPLPTTLAGPQARSVAAAPTQYTVVDGDTVSAIAGRFGLSTASVLALNGLGWSAVIFPGQTLTLSTQAAPLAAAPATKPVATEIARHTIRSGDTIGAIAAAHGLTTNQVLSANGLHASSVIFPGQSIVLPSASAAAVAPAAAAQPVMATVAQVTPVAAPTHTIAAGDTIVTVAAVAGVSVQAILDANALGWSSIIYPGQVLAIPLPVAADAVTPLTEEMRQNAATIVSVGRAAGVNDEGLVVALAAAAQESGMRNVDFGDRDSLGLFQQRPSAGWGSAEQVMDPVRASRAFFGGAGNPNAGVTRGLLDISGWESLTLTQAAQAVQVSAFPDHYAKWEVSARAWLAQL